MKFACALVLLVVMYASPSSAGPIPFEDIQDVEVRYCDFRTQYKSIQITKFANFASLHISAFYNISQPTKLCNFTHFSMLFPEIYFYAKIKISL
jgi:hypothetical protein